MLPLVYARCTGVDPSDEKIENGRIVEIDGPVKFEMATVELIDERQESEDEEDEKDHESQTTVRQRGGKGEKLDDTVSSSSSSTIDSSSTTADSTISAPLDLRQSPTQWFGALIPPTLPVAASHFRATLNPLMTIATLSESLKMVQKKFEYLSQLQQSSHVDPDVEEELRGILDKIQISREKKMADKSVEPNASTQIATKQNLEESSN